MTQEELVNLERNLQIILADLNSVTRMMEDRSLAPKPCAKLELSNERFGI